MKVLRGDVAAAPPSLAKLDVCVRRTSPRVQQQGDKGQICNGGLRNPYPGKLDVVEVGALADLLLVDGDPLANIELMADSQKNFVVIMKDGGIHKNSLL